MKKNVFTLIAVIAIGLTILACNLGVPNPEGNATDQPSAPFPVETAAPVPSENSKPAANAGTCANPYMPVILGATWNYNMVGATSDTYIHSITAVEDNGFTEQDAFGTGVTRQGQWKCENGDLTALNPTGSGSANVSTEGMSIDFQTTSLSGITFPANPTVGSSWSQSVTLEGISSMNGLEIPAKNQVDTACTAIGSESITVPAGTFDALRVDCKISMNIVITMQGNEIPTSLNMNSSAWYALNIGMVKSVSSGSNLDSTIELTSYSIP